MIRVEDKSSSFRLHFRYYLFVFFIALAVRGLFLFFIDDPILFTKYPFFAEKVAAGENIGNRLVDLSPFYLYFLVFFKKVLNVDWQGLKVLQSILGAVNCLLVLALGSSTFGKSVGLVAALFFGFYGNLIILESTLEPTVFVILFNLLTVLFLTQLRLPSAGRFRWWVLPFWSGAFAGLSAITKPNFLLFFPIAAVYLLFLNQKGNSLRHRASRTVVFLLAGCAIIMTVTIRNYVAVDDVVLVTADAGKVFFHGNGQGATALEGTGLVDEGFSQEGASEPDYAHVLYRKKAETLLGKTLQPSESSRFWLRQALRDIAEDPTAYLILEAKKLFYFFNDYEMHYIASAYSEYKAILSFPLIRYGMISCLALFGMGLCLVRPIKAYLIFGGVFVYLLSCMLLLVQSRYRTPAVPYLCLFAAYGVVFLKDTFKKRRIGGLVAGLLALGPLCGVTHFVYTDEIAAVDQWQQATKVHYQMGGRRLFNLGRYEEAIAALEPSISLAPRFSPAYNLRGKAYAIMGNHEAAARDFEFVIRLSPRQAKGYKNLGFLHLLQGRQEAAMHWLSKALALAPDDEKVKKALQDLQEG